MMNPEAHAVATMIYPMLLTATIVAGTLGIVVNRGGSRRVGIVMIACQLALLGLATGVGWPEYHLASMVLLNGLSAVPLVLTPPTPPPLLQRYAAGMFLALAMINAFFGFWPQTPWVVAMHWFASASIDALMITMLGGWCGGVIARDVIGRIRDHAHHSPVSGDRR